MNHIDMLFYLDGEIKYVGQTKEINDKKIPYGFGTEYWPNNNKKREGYFQQAGLLYGKMYDKNGQLYYEGLFNDKVNEDGKYYGPSYPTIGKYYKDGKLIYEGKFKISKLGSVGYPHVEIPVGFPELG